MKPGKLAGWLLSRLLPSHIRLTALGDFEEIFSRIGESQGRGQASCWIWYQIFKLLLPAAGHAIYWRMTMLINYLKIAFRNLKHQKFYAMINIAGLAVGIACFLLIMLFVRNELSYDRHHENASRIHRLTLDARFGGTLYRMAAAAAPTAAALERDYPEVEEAVRLYLNGSPFVSHESKTFKEERVAWADGDLFKVFTLPLVRGDENSALQEPNSLVISREMAQKYFGSLDAVGKTLSFDGVTDYQVTGVFQEMPEASHFHFDMLASLVTLDDSRDSFWLNNITFKTYLLLKENTNPAALVAKFPDMVMTYCAPMMERLNGRTYEEQVNSGLSIEFGLQPLTDIHLHSDKEEEFEPNGDIKIVWIFSAVGVFILLLAGINYINLSTARSARRAREVGIRKAAGSSRGALVQQFLTESVLLTFIALVLALFLAMSALPAFNSISGKSLTLHALFHAEMVGLMLAVLFTLGVAAGGYPALYLSSFHPVSVMKGRILSGNRGRHIRNGLVVFQFAVSLILIIGTAVVFQQLQYAQNIALGFDKEHVLVVHDTYILGRQSQAFKEKLLSLPEVSHVTVSGFLPVQSRSLIDVMTPEGDFSERGAPMERWFVDGDYFDTMGMTIKSGRNFRKGSAADSLAILVNESAVRRFGWENPLGKTIRDLRTTNPRTYYEFNVIGVVEDFHFASLRKTISPLVFHREQENNLISLRFTTRDIPGLIAKVKDAWNQFSPETPFAWSFLDDRFDNVYRGDRRLGRLFSIFASLALFIGCLGLLGLVAYLAECKTKEIGIRKVLGAGRGGILLLLCRDLLKWVVLANLAAWPVAWFAMEKWLQNFAYRTHLGIEIFAVAGAGALLMALITVMIQALKAANSHPARSLKYE